MQFLLDNNQSVLNLDFQVLACLNQWVMDKRIQELENVLLVLSQNAKDYLT